MKQFIIVGYTDHALSVAEAILQNGDALAGVLDDHVTESELAEVPIVGRLKDLSKWADEGCCFISGSRDHLTREKQALQYPDLNWQAVVHPCAVCGLGAVIGKGAFIGAGAVIGAGATVGEYTTVEAGAVIGVKAVIAPFCQILSRVSIGAGVNVGTHTFIGQSATLKDRVKISEKTVIQTGEIVVKDMVMKMVFKRGAWIYKENGLEEQS